MLDRRQYLLGSIGAGLVSQAGCATAPDPEPGQVPVAQAPPFWRLDGVGGGCVWLLGFADAKDESWLTPSIRDAFSQSDTLWLETQPPGSDPDTRRAEEDLRTKLGRSSGPTFFEALEPGVRERAIAYAEELQIPRAQLDPLRPWLAYYRFAGAFFSRVQTPYVYADERLRAEALRQGKAVEYEMSATDVIRFFAGMSPAAESQYLGWLLDFLDERKAMGDGDSFDWIQGKPSGALRSLDRMRTKAPDLYRLMQVERNRWWTDKILQLRDGGGKAFVALGMLHVLGPDGVPAQLSARNARPSVVV